MQDQPTPKKPGRKPHRLVRVPLELHNKLAELAKADDRTVNAYIVHLLKRATEGK
jgi:predicted HicB family RNase H-like nuclease